MKKTILAVCIASFTIVHVNATDFKTSHTITIGGSFVKTGTWEGFGDGYDSGFSATYAYHSTKRLAYTLNYSNVSYDYWDVETSKTIDRDDKIITGGAEFGTTFGGAQFSFHPYVGAGISNHSEDGIGAYGSIGFKETIGNILTGKLEFRLDSHDSTDSQFQAEVGFRF